ncbi:hypothetical protein [Paenibacillus larvae]|uniref:hypothetical protein n=1 Tax=Paenibacillus larvae TaxID=1464 RepID=UPI0026AEB824
MSYYLGLDAGGTKTYVVIVDETGRVAEREEAVHYRHAGRYLPAVWSGRHLWNRYQLFRHEPPG